jgi:hypothetical protein
MDLLSPLRLGVHVAADAVKLATAVPRFVKHQLTHDDRSTTVRPVGRPTTPPAATPSSPARADAAVAAEPGPAAATSAPTRPPVRQGPRRENDVRPPSARTRRATTPRRAEVDRRREAARERGPAAGTVAGSEGGAAPSAAVHVDAPWEGYDTMKAAEIVRRLRSSDEATKGVVRLYEQAHKKRKSVLDATAT